MKTIAKTDLYTKVILTVIAVFLGILVFQNTNLITPTYASTPPAPVPASAKNEVVDVNIVQVDGYGVSISRGIKVYVDNDN